MLNEEEEEEKTTEKPTDATTPEPRNEEPTRGAPAQATRTQGSEGATRPLATWWFVKGLVDMFNEHMAAVFLMKTCAAADSCVLSSET